MKIRFRTSERAEGWLAPRPDKGIKVTTLHYGYAFRETGSFSEWEIVVLMVGRQDGKTAWSVQLIEVDSSIHATSGITQTDVVKLAEALETALWSVTTAARWIEPINADRAPVAQEARS